MSHLIKIFLYTLTILPSVLNAEEVVKVGIPTVLTGDLAVLGDNLQKTAETYKKRYLRHPIQFIFEDAKKSGTEGMAAYKKLIEFDRVNMLIGGTVSNGTMAGAPLINKSKTVTITPLTGGSNIDKAGEYIFRIGNSDVLNARQQADIFLAKGFNRAAILTEQTEYTQDIAGHFRPYFQEKGGKLVFDEDFLPDMTSFKSTITRLKAKNPQAIFMSTQTGLAFGIFIKEFKQLNPGSNIEIYTNFLAASNPDAFKAAGDAIWGVKYLAPSFDNANPKLNLFFAEFKKDHGADPAIGFHTAGMVDSLDMLQAYLDTLKGADFSSTGFHDYLLSNIKSYKGLMGTYSFDSEGNADIGFTESEIQKAG